MSDQLVQTPPASAPTFENVDAMIGEVASLVGGDQDPDARAKALTCLDRAADRMNLAGIWLYRLQENTWASAAAGGTGDNLLSNGAQTLTRPADFGFPQGEGLVYNSDDELIGRLMWRGWDTFRTFISNLGATPSIPAFASVRSIHEDPIYLWPFVDTAEVAKIILPYCARVQRPSEATTLYLLPEIREALTTVGEYFMMRYRYAGQPGIYESFRREAIRAETQAKAISDRWYNNSIGLNIIPDLDGYRGQASTSFQLGQVYIKV